MDSAESEAMTEETKPAPQKVTYWAFSILTSRTFLFNAANLLVAALSMTEIVTLIPSRYLPFQAAVVALVNMYLRSVTTRPVAMILPAVLGGSGVKPVEVDRIGPPPPPVVTD